MGRLSEHECELLPNLHEHIDFINLLSMFYSTIIITDGVTGDQERISDVICLVTSNPLIKTRKFFRNFDRGYPLRTFTGPGML